MIRPPRHWLYGEVKLKKAVKKETICQQCIHREVCTYDFVKLCTNYSFGTSAEGFQGCSSCSHRFTRYDKDPIPCFYCPHFVLTKEKIADRHIVINDDKGMLTICDADK